MQCLRRWLTLPPIHPVAFGILVEMYGPIKGRVVALVLRVKLARALHGVPQAATA